MKVIKRNPWSKQITCYHCKSELEIEESDILAGEEGSMGDYDLVYYVKCAVCKGDINLRELDIPIHIREEALSKYRRRR